MCCRQNLNELEVATFSYSGTDICRDPAAVDKSELRAAVESKKYDEFETI